jgi:hypothetical protein
MKNITKTVLASAGISTCIVTSAFAQPFPGSTWTIDENGPAILSNPVGYSVGRYQPDPVSGIVGWYYPLAGTPTLPGDVVLTEPQAPTGTISDLLRFDGQGGVYFFSDLEPGEPNPDKADVPVIPQPMPNPINNPVFITEVGPEGNNGVLYIPQPGQPGFDTSGILPGIQYNIISDAVPEPTAATFLLAGAGLWLFNTARRKRS